MISVCALIAVWLNISLRSRDCVQLNRSANALSNAILDAVLYKTHITLSCGKVLGSKPELGHGND